MYLNNPIGLSLLALIPVLWGARWFCKRPPRRRIAGIFLWSQVRQAHESDRTSMAWTTLSESVAAAALAMLASDIRVATNDAEASAGFALVVIQTLLVLIAAAAMGWSWFGLGRIYTARAAGQSER